MHRRWSLRTAGTSSKLTFSRISSPHPPHARSGKLDGMLVPFRSKFDEREPFRGQLATWDPVNEILRVVFEYTGIVQKMEINQ